MFRKAIFTILWFAGFAWSETAQIRGFEGIEVSVDKPPRVGTLDVSFAEDACQVRSAHAPQNLSLLRRIALNALNREQSFSRSTLQKSNRAATMDLECAT